MSAEVYQCGDYNKDGQVDVDDVVEMIGILFPP